LLTHTCSHTLAHTHFLTHTCSHTLAHKHLLTHTCSQTLAHTHSLTHTHLCALTHTRTCAHITCTISCTDFLHLLSAWREKIAKTSLAALPTGLSVMLSWTFQLTAKQQGLSTY